jgi:hypothetical protein
MGAKTGVLEHEFPRYRAFSSLGNTGFSDDENYIFN